MLSLLRRLPLAVLLTLSAAVPALGPAFVPAFGGEWHSAGNAPTPPYFPKTPANYTCHITATTDAGTKMYRIEHDVEFKDAQFQLPGMGFVNYELKNESDPGMNGQGFSLSFSPDWNGGETMNLSVYAEIKDRSGTIGSSSRVRAPRIDGKIIGTANVDVYPKKGNSRSAEVEVTCTTR